MCNDVICVMYLYIVGNTAESLRLHNYKGTPQSRRFPLIRTFLVQGPSWTEKKHVYRYKTSPTLDTSFIQSRHSKSKGVVNVIPVDIKCRGA